MKKSSANTAKVARKPVENASKASGDESVQTQGLTKLGNPEKFIYDSPHASILEAFPNRHPERDYTIIFEHPEFTSLCPMTGQPDFGTIHIQYVPGQRCVESKAFKLYMGSFRNHGSFMESIVNTIADDLISVLEPRRLRVEGVFNVRGGTAITVIVDYIDDALSEERKEALQHLW